MFKGAKYAIITKMTHSFYDMRVNSAHTGETAGMLHSLGWQGGCIMRSSETKVGPVPEMLLAEMISPKTPDSVQKMARNALEKADIVMVAGGDEEINRAASECWEVDVLCHPERVPGKDPLDQKNSGLDDVMARFMAERGIAVEICLSELLSCYGVVRAQVMGRMRQNVRLARKYKTPIIITSGAMDRFGMRAPQDLYSLGIALGMDPGLAKKAVSDYPAMLIKKSVDRRNSGVLLAGLEVVSWGTSKGKQNKKMFGWY